MIKDLAADAKQLIVETARDGNGGHPFTEDHIWEKLYSKGWEYRPGVVGDLLDRAEVDGFIEDTGDNSLSLNPSTFGEPLRAFRIVPVTIPSSSPPEVPIQESMSSNQPSNFWKLPDVVFCATHNATHDRSRQHLDNGDQCWDEDWADLYVSADHPADVLDALNWGKRDG